MATAPAGWTAISGFPVLGPLNTGAEPWFNPGADHAVRVYGWWRRVVGGETNPTVTATNGHGIIFAVRGQPSAGVPVESVTYNGGAWNATSTPAGVTASPDCLVVAMTCDSATGRNVTSYTNADLASLTEQIDITNAGAGNNHYATGGKASAGAFGATAIVISAGADGEWIGVSLVLASVQTSRDVVLYRRRGSRP